MEIALQPKQLELLELITKSKYTKILFGGANGGGKLLSVDQLIPTPTGYKSMGEIEVGDYVLSSNGHPVKVIWTSEIEPNPDAYELEFDTGEKIKADARHLWKTFSFDERRKLVKYSEEFRAKRRENRPSRALLNPKNKAGQINITKANKERVHNYLPIPEGSVRNTKELYLSQLSATGQTNHSIQNTEALQLKEADLPIDPYVLGLYLGDGHKNTARIGMLCDDFEEVMLTSKENVISKTIDKRKDKEYAEYQIEGLRERLKELKILKDKRIPISYLRSSLRQRIALLQGILDTDGYCSKNGQIELGLSKPDLMEDVHELVCSMGIKCTIRVKKLSLKNPNHNDSHRIKFITGIPVFRLKRKLERQNLSPTQIVKQRFIVSIKKCEPVPMKCIQVENPDGMYLVGRTFIPTHNSEGIRMVNLVLCIRKKKFPVKTLIFRRKSNDLLENHINPFFQRFPGIEKYFNKTERMIYWPDGSTTKFGSADSEKDIYDYEGKEYDYIFVDEATHSTQMMIEFLISRNRSPYYKAKMIFTSIPGHIGHAYIKRLFVTKKYLDYEDPKDYVYLPARVWDNVVWSENALQEQGFTPAQYYTEWNEERRKEFTIKFSDYAKTLTHLPEAKRRARLFGDWDVIEGNFFDTWDNEVHIVRPNDYLLYEQLLQWNVGMGLDYGNVTVLECIARDFNGNYILFDELYQEKMNRTRKIQQALEFLNHRGLMKKLIIADTNMWIKDAFDVDNATMPAQDYINAGMRLLAVSKSSSDKNKGYRENCNDNVKDVLDYNMDEFGKITRPPKLLVYERCGHFIETFPTLITDANNQDDIADGQPDHCYDAFKMILMYLRQPYEKVNQEALLRQVARPTALKGKHWKGGLNDKTLRM